MRHRSLLACALGLFSSGTLLAQATPPPATPTTAQPPAVALEEPALAASPSRVWFNAEHVLWWIKPHPLPVPVATYALPPFTTPNPGALGDPGTVIALGDKDIGTSVRNGGRFTAGLWLDDAQQIGLETSYFFLGRRDDSRGVAINGNVPGPALGVPIFDPTGVGTGTGAPGETFLVVGIPGLSSAFSSVTVSTFLEGGELNGIFKLSTTAARQVELIAGVRYLHLEEKMTLANDLAGVGPIAGVQVALADQFNTNNRFYGPQVGVRTSTTFGRFFASGTAKLGIGEMHQTIHVAGVTSTGGGIGDGVLPGGIFAQASNSGDHSHDSFSVIPEVNLNVGVNVTRNIQAYIGYTFLEVTGVLRPGDQLDHQLNLTQAPAISGVPPGGPARPVLPFKTNDFWTQGLNFGVALRY